MSSRLYMPSLSERLQALGVKVGPQDLLTPEPSKSLVHSIQNVLPGDWWQTANGEVYFVETRYAADMVVGKVGIRPMVPLDIITDWAQTPDIAQLALERFAFIDIETTGLSGGAGTYAFLIGAGRFEGDQFRLVQFFLQNPSQETALLQALEEYLAPCQSVVSYNGKTFDVPIINARYITNGFPPLLRDTAHIDLLHLARRIWKLRLSRCTLGDLEVNILGMQRSEQDVPGWMVADLYFEYLRTGDARPLRGVFYHNEVDVVSLAALLSHLAEIVTHPFETSNLHSLDLVSVGRLFEHLGRLEKAAGVYRFALEQTDLPQDVYWDTAKRLSFVFKRRGDIEPAMKLWQEAAGHNFVFACEELAKYYEHNQKDFYTAMVWTDKALNMITDQPGSALDRLYWQETLEHRKSRLEKKLLNAQSGDNLR